MKKVVHLLPCTGPLSPEQEAYFTSLLTAQREAGWEVELILMGAPSLDCATGLTVTHFTYPLQGWPLIAPLQRWWARRRWRQFLRERQEVSLIHLHLLTATTLPLAWPARQGEGPVWLASFYQAAPWLTRPLTRWQLQWLDAHLRRLTVPDKELQRLLVLEVGLSPSRIHVVPPNAEAAPLLVALYDDALGREREAA